VHYPRSAGELRSWFGTDADCLDYLVLTATLPDDDRVDVG
jgi:hypothetical protein